MVSPLMGTRHHYSLTAPANASSAVVRKRRGQKFEHLDTSMVLNREEKDYFYSVRVLVLFYYMITYNVGLGLCWVQILGQEAFFFKHKDFTLRFGMGWFHIASRISPNIPIPWHRFVITVHFL